MKDKLINTFGVLAIVVIGSILMLANGGCNVITYYLADSCHAYVQPKSPSEDPPAPDGYGPNKFWGPGPYDNSPLLPPEKYVPPAPPQQVEKGIGPLQKA